MWSIDVLIVITGSYHLTIMNLISVGHVEESKTSSLFKLNISHLEFAYFPSKAQLAKNGLFYGLCPSCLKLESMKHILWECSFAIYYWDQVQSQLTSIIQGNLHWWETLFVDYRSLG